MHREIENSENDSHVQHQAEDQGTGELSQRYVPTETETPSEQLTGYELVADMLRRQDDVIAELDALNLRIESAIKEISDARQLEVPGTAGAMAKPDLADVASSVEDSAESADTAA